MLGLQILFPRCKNVFIWFRPRHKSQPREFNSCLSENKTCDAEIIISSNHGSSNCNVTLHPAVKKQMWTMCEDSDQQPRSHCNIYSFITVLFFFLMEFLNLFLSRLAGGARCWMWDWHTVHVCGEVWGQEGHSSRPIGNHLSGHGHRQVRHTPASKQIDLNVWYS